MDIGGFYSFNDLPRHSQLIPTSTINHLRNLHERFQCAVHHKRLSSCMQEERFSVLNMQIFAALFTPPTICNFFDEKIIFLLYFLFNI